MTSVVSCPVRQNTCWFWRRISRKNKFRFSSKKTNFFLASYRLLCYNVCFSGEYSSISQEYPPSKLKVRDTIYAACKQAKEKYK